MRAESRIKQYFAIGGRNLAVELTPDWAEVYLYCEDILRLARQVPRRDLPADPVRATAAILEPFKKRFNNRPMSPDDLEWEMRRRLLEKIGIQTTEAYAFLAYGSVAVHASRVKALGLPTIWRIRRQIKSPKQHPALWGLRAWELEGQVLVSPIRSTPWPTPVLQAHEMDPSALVDGHSGIHALHAPSASTLQQALGMGYYILSGCHYINTVWGLVRPYGKTVIGPNGWRAEFAEIIALMTKYQPYALMLEERYGVPCFLFEEG